MSVALGGHWLKKNPTQLKREFCSAFQLIFPWKMSSVTFSFWKELMHSSVLISLILQRLAA